VGGAETVIREIALGLVARGWEVEILSTCAVDHYTWKNVLPAGRSVEDGLVVHRFPTVCDLSGIGRRAQDRIEAGTVPSVDEQLSWMGFQFRAPDLFHHLVRFGPGFEAVVFSPYLSWTTSVGIHAVTDRAIVIPCLHDELYARLEVFEPVLSRPASVWFMSEPEHELAHRLGPVASHHVVTGEGFHPPASYDPEGFRRRHGIERPFVLFAGRREPGKGWDSLLEVFSASVAAGVDVDLVSIGVGKAAVPSTLEGRVTDLGFLSSAERDNAFAAALAYIQPSRMESFSRTVMEAWLAGSPVMATAEGEVVAWHCQRSGGGVLYRDAGEFVSVLGRLVADPDERRRLAELGRRYVMANYSWDAVLDVMEDELRPVAWTASS